MPRLLRRKTFDFIRETEGLKLNNHLDSFKFEEDTSGSIGKTNKTVAHLKTLKEVTSRMEGECPWHVYDDGSRGILGVGLYITGITSLILTSLMLAGFLKTSLTNDRSYLTLLNLCVVFLARSLVGFLFSGVSAVAGRWLFGSTSCMLYGFFYQFISCYQMEAVTHMCIERYVLAKYIKNGWEMTKGRYTLFVSLCFFFSSLYSIPPLIGISEYSWDYSCSQCTLYMVLPPVGMRRYTFITILLMQSLKPLFFIASMLYWARQIEKERYNEKEHNHHLLFTQSVMRVSFTTLLFWTPTFIASSWVILTQLLQGSVMQPPLILVMMASFGTEIAPAATTISIFWTNEHVRRAVLGLFGESTRHKDA